MVRYFLKSGFRSIIKHRSVSFIGILSISVGISVLILIGIYTGNELSVDRIHNKASRIYKVSYGNSSFTPGLLSSTLLENFPEIQNATHIETHQLFAFSPVLNYNNQSFEINGYYSVDSSFLKIFDFKVLHGDINSAMSSPFSIILTESEAMRIFNSQNPIGKTAIWKIYNDYTFTVAAIVEDPPQNSSLRFHGLISESSLENMGRHYHDDWGYTSFETYLLLHPDIDAMMLEQKLRGFLIDYYATNLSSKACYADASTNPLELHALRDVYFNEGLANDTTNKGNMLQIRILIAVGIIIMLISIINYINLYVAKATTRAKEIGIQRVCGSSKRSLVVQYLTETTIISFIAAIIGLIIAGLILPGFSQFMNLSQTLKFSHSFLLMTIPGIILLGIIAGIYPAFIMSSQGIVHILGKRPFQGNRGVILRYALIIFQFSVSMLLITNTLIINKQVNFLKNEDLGIAKEEVIYAKMPYPIMRGNKEVFRDQILELPDIERVSFSSTVFGKIESINNLEIDGRVINFSSIWTDAEFVDLYNIKLSKGRMFSRESNSDVNSTALLNESAVKEFDVEDPFEIEIRVPGGQAKVVGIVRDFNFKSLHDRIEPLAIVYLPRQAWYANIKMSGSNHLQTLSSIEKIWSDLAPGFPFNYQFLEASLDMQYENDEQMRQAIMYFSIIAMVIAVLGIIGLSIFICEKRVMELGIHKINGAKSWDLLILLNRNFLVILGASFILACPVSWYFMNNWLDGFAYKTSIDIWIYLVSGLLVTIFSLTVVSWLSWQYAKRNPVDALRYE